jgi:hypothetical protein
MVSTLVGVDVGLTVFCALNLANNVSFFTDATGDVVFVLPKNELLPLLEELLLEMGVDLTEDDLADDEELLLLIDREPKLEALPDDIAAFKSCMTNMQSKNKMIFMDFPSCCVRKIHYIIL